MLPASAVGPQTSRGFETIRRHGAQLDRIKQFVPQTDLLKLAACGPCRIPSTRVVTIQRSSTTIAHATLA